MYSSYRLNIRDITNVAVAASLAVVLGLIGKMFGLQLPQGGSITLEVVPILLVALWRGARIGVAAGLITGLLKILFGAYILHPIQLLLDYPLPFSLLGIVGLFSSLPRLGILVVSLLRFFCHFLSGVIYFSSFAPEGVSVWRYSALYNLSYTAPEALIGILLVPLLLKRLPVGI